MWVSKSALASRRLFAHFAIVLRPELVGQNTRDPASSSRLVGQRTEHPVELEALEPGNQLAKRPFPVLGEEETGIGETGTDDPLVALPNQTLGVVLAVDDSDEIRILPTIVVLEDQALLVVTKGRDHDLGRQLEVSLFEGTRHQTRPLHELHVLGQQRGVRVDPGAGALGELHRQLFESLRRDSGSAITLCSTSRRRNLSRREIESLRRVDPVAHRGPPARHAEELERNHFVVQQRHDAVHRAHEMWFPSPHRIIFGKRKAPPPPALPRRGSRTWHALREPPSR